MQYKSRKLKTEQDQDEFDDKRKKRDRASDVSAPYSDDEDDRPRKKSSRSRGAPPPYSE